MAVLRVEKLGKMFGGEFLWRDISFSIGEGEKVALIGPNGCGKTTLVRCLEEQLLPDEGEIFFARNRFVASLSQQLTDEEKRLTLREFVLDVFGDLLEMEEKMRHLRQEMEMASGDTEELNRLVEKFSTLSERFGVQGGYLLETRVRETVFGLGFSSQDMDRPVGQFSGGQKTRIGLARALVRQPDILIMDEPNNYLDLKALAWLENFLAGYPGAVLVVSHDRYFLDRTVQRVLEFENGRLYSYRGNYSAFVVQKESNVEAHNRAYEKQQEKIRETEEFIRRYKAGIKSRQARGRQSQLDRLERLEKRGQSVRSGIRLASGELSGEKVLRLRDFGVSWPGRPIVNGVNLEILRGDRIALMGPNGCGKTTFLRALAGEIPYEGKVVYGANVETAYFAQEHDDLPGHLTVLDYVMDQGVGTYGEARGLLGSFGFSGDDVFKECRRLSGGEKSRLSLARILLAAPNLLILDEPTNHLDIYARQALEEALEAYEGTLLFVSHDRYFLQRISARFLVFDGEGLSFFEGTYESYMENLNRPAVSRGEGEPEETPEKPRDRKEERIRRAELGRVESRITELEESIRQLQDRMVDPEVYADGEKSRQCQEDLSEAESELENCLEKWEQLMED